MIRLEVVRELTESLTDLQTELATDLDRGFVRLVSEYQDRLYSFALRMTGSPQDAEEIAQDAFVRAYRALESYPGDRIHALSVKAWLYQITMNVARNRVRGKHLRLVPLDEPGDAEDGAPRFEPEDDGCDRPEPAFERAERRQELGALVAGLPERYRAPVVLRYVESLSYAEVAAVLAQPVGTTKANVHRGLKLLREALLERMSEVS